MDPIYFGVGVVVMGIVPTVVIFFIKRQVTNADRTKAEADKEKETAHEQQLNGFGLRVSRIEDRVRELELSEAKLISREELQDTVRTLTGKVDRLQQDLTDFIRDRRN